ncbi:hypothetical protein B0H17DRAFT_1237081 [Mycena rosella]|uniref:Uncharacterized protein n=1 Tax=Mycena rosella TaxID=1033263 RepID=A0AAD7GQ65_MYCRO|nr:hypothetical protein B0H17DRAFT_1237081 [Mycena rosella]
MDSGTISSAHQFPRDVIPKQYSEITPLRRTLTVPSLDPTAPPLSNGTWIWSTSDAAYDAVPGSVGFRKTFTSPVGRIAQSATILITVDNQFTMYANEAYIGASQDWTNVQQLKTNLNATANTFTVIARNWAALNHDTNTWTDPSSAGVIAAIRIEYADGSSDVVGTDTSWLSGDFTTVSEFMSMPDSALFPTYNIGTMGMQPWGPLPSSTLSPSATSGTNPSSTPGALASGGHRRHIALIVGPVMGVLALIAIIIWWLLRNIRRDSRPAPGSPDHRDKDSGSNRSNSSATVIN